MTTINDINIRTWIFETPRSKISIDSFKLHTIESSRNATNYKNNLIYISINNRGSLFALSEEGIIDSNNYY
jgi:hypothetical protein